MREGIECSIQDVHSDDIAIAGISGGGGAEDDRRVVIAGASVARKTIILLALALCRLAQAKSIVLT